MRVMIVVTHLLGTGHLARALTLGRAFADAGHRVMVLSGGLPVPHFETVGLQLEQLAPLRSDGTDFTTLLDAQGAQAGPAYRAARIATALDRFHSFAPDVLITELFPFGRRNLRDEFMALLDAATAKRTVILSSVRDILAPPSKPAKVAFADDMVQRYYRGVLVHADRDIVTLDQSWPVSDTLAPYLNYTGFVAPPAPAGASERNDTILVSAGGGAVGDTIYDTALASAVRHPDTTWHLLVGGEDMRRNALAARAPQNVVVDAPRPDFRNLLMHVGASVSMCGYNTALDLLQTGVPAVIIPFDDGNEVEQGLRAAALAQQPGITVVRQDALIPDTLMSALHAVRQEERTPRRIGMTGAAEAVRITGKLWGRNHGQP
ncbi:glycosyltransferase [uncultured Tateyamaria sp.]|uniref:glycosyltransferase family protein n=1 Tax=Tateyamaria sp. 1078 TaxID=3417464 RepID=UPI0026223C9D|nr:glycosyltransferase [uncultured Tateyamaria sp.]